MTEPRAGAIHDLGYRRYEGARLGRRHAIVSLYVHGLRSAFGLGRRARAKIFPVGLIIFAIFPAFIQVAFGALASEDLEVFRAEDYYGYINLALAVFVAVAAPELLGRDQRHQTLPLYFSRAFSRHDYALARLAAMVTAMFALTLLPQALLFVGNALVVDDFGGYFRDEWRQVGPIVASGLLASAFFAAIGMTIATLVQRSMYAIISILGLFVVLSLALGPLLVNFVDNLAGRLGVFLSPFAVMDGFTRWFFGAGLDDDPLAATADFAGGAYFLWALALTALGGAFVVRRYGRKSL